MNAQVVDIELLQCRPSRLGMQLRGTYVGQIG